MEDKEKVVNEFSKEHSVLEWNLEPMDTSATKLLCLRPREHGRRGGKKVVRARGPGSLQWECFS